MAVGNECQIKWMGAVIFGTVFVWSMFAREALVVYYESLLQLMFQTLNYEMIKSLDLHDS